MASNTPASVQDRADIYGNEDDLLTGCNKYTHPTSMYLHTLVKLRPWKGRGGGICRKMGLYTDIDGTCKPMNQNADNHCITLNQMETKTSPQWALQRNSTYYKGWTVDNAIRPFWVDFYGSDEEGLYMQNSTIPSCTNFVLVIHTRCWNKYRQM